MTFSTCPHDLSTFWPSVTRVLYFAIPHLASPRPASPSTARMTSTTISFFIFNSSYSDGGTTGDGFPSPFPPIPLGSPLAKPVGSPHFYSISYNLSTYLTTAQTEVKY